MYVALIQCSNRNLLFFTVLAGLGTVAVTVTGCGTITVTVTGGGATCGGALTYLGGGA